MTPDPPADATDIALISGPDRPRHRRWRAVFRLRVLMILVLVVGGLLGWKARRASIQRRAVAHLKAIGATVSYDWQVRTPTKPAGAAPPGPEWLRRVVGDESFQEVQQATLDGEKVELGEPSGASLGALASLDRLERLDMIDLPVNDAHLARLAGLPALKTVLLLDDKLTGAALDTARTWPRLEVLAIRFDPAQPPREVLPRLAGMTQLRRLNLGRIGPVGPAELAPLATLTDLEYLSLWPSPADEGCLASLAGLTRLTGLHLPTTRVTDAGMRHLAPLTALERVALDGAALTDDGLTVVALWPKMQELFLVGPAVGGAERTPTGLVTDRGLASLAGHPSLDNLTLAGRFADAGLAALNRVPKLDTLILYGLGPDATADGLRALLAGRQFRQLGLHGPGVRADWAPALAGQTRLDYLSLAGPNATDATLSPLAGMPSLARLFLADAPITDAGLMTLARGNNALRFLSLRGTAATPAGVAAFQAARRSCQVDYRPGP